MFEAVCPNGHRLHVPAEHAGMKLRCPACNAIFQLTIPRNDGTAAAAGASATGTAGTAAPATSAASPAVGTATTAGPAAAQVESAGARWSGTEPSATSPAAATAPRATPQSMLPAVGDWMVHVATLTHGALLIGLVLVLTAKGCDGLAAKNVARIQGQGDLQQRIFDEEREQAMLDVQSQLDDPNTAASRRAPLQKELEDVQAKFDKRRRELQKGEWRLAANAAARVTAENREAAYWREMLFVAGTIMFALGLLMNALLGQGAERWLSFGLLAIILFSVYVGGMAWSSSLSGIGGR